MKDNPRRTAIVGGSSAGGWDHLKILIVADKAGISDLKAINYISFDNGGTAMLEILSKRADAFTGDISELVEYDKKGNIRILAILAPDRIPAVPSAKLPKNKGMTLLEQTGEVSMSPKTSQMLASTSGWSSSQKLLIQANGLT